MSLGEPSPQSRNSPSETLIALARLRALEEAFADLCRVSEDLGPFTPEVQRVSLAALDMAAASLAILSWCESTYGCFSATLERIARIKEWATFTTAAKVDSYGWFAMDVTSKPLHEGGPIDSHSWGEQLTYWIGRLEEANSIEKAGRLAVASLSGSGEVQPSQKKRGRQPMTPKHRQQCEEYARDYRAFLVSYTAKNGSRAGARKAFAKSKGMNPSQSNAMIRSGTPAKPPPRKRGQNRRG